MATYGTNILPAFNTTDWSLSDATISNGILTANQWGHARYQYVAFTTDSEGNEVYYNAGDMIEITAASCTGRYTINVHYWDVSSGEGFNQAVEINSNTLSAQIELQSASVKYIYVTAYCITASSLGSLSLKFRVQPNTSGSGTATLSGGGTGTDNTKVYAHEFFAGPTSGRGRASWREIYGSDLPEIPRAKGGVGDNTSSVLHNEVYAGPSSGSGSGNANFRELVLADLPLSIYYNGTAYSRLTFTLTGTELDITLS